MSKPLDIRCPTPFCQKRVEELGDSGNRVYSYTWDYRVPVDIKICARCDSCGGLTDGASWYHVCSVCGKRVDPGELRGLFVPHMCSDCVKKKAEEEIKKGHVCGFCRNPFSQCCC